MQTGTGDMQGYIADSNYKWAASLNNSQIRLLFEKSTLLTYEKGESILKQGSLASQIYFVEEGIAKLNFESSGRDTTFAFATNGDFIGLMCSFVKKRLEFSAVAITTTKVRIIERDIFEELIGSNGGFAVNIVKLMSEVTNSVVHMLITLSHKNVNGSVASLLITLSKLYNSDSFQIPFSRDEMASALGYSKESVINTLSSFHQDQIVSVSGRNLKILQPNTLVLVAEKG